jgi:tryptophanyl-tRNA synthetase
MLRWRAGRSRRCSANLAAKGFGKFKPALGELLVETLAPINAKFVELKQDREMLDAILAKGALQARELARPTLDAAYQALGLVRG